MNTYIDNESAVIGCIVLNAKAAGEICTALQPADFESRALADCFDQLCGLWKKDGRVDAATISQLPGMETILKCAETVPSMSGYGVYAKNVKDAAIKRRAKIIGLQIASESMEPDEIMQKSAEIAHLFSERLDAGWVDAQQGTIEFIKRQQAGKPNYIDTGYKAMNDFVFLSRGDYLVVGGRPSSGKTAFSLNMAVNLARKGMKVAYFSLETSPDKIYDRMIAAWLMVDFDAVKLCNMKMDTEAARGLDAFAKLPIFVRSASGQTAAWIRAEAERLGADAVFVDYIGLVKDAEGDRYAKITNISIALHEMAQSDHRLVVALSQLSRAGKGAPTLESLRESGQIEQDADAVILLHNGEDEYRVIVAKNKEGRCGDLPLTFNKDKQRFVEEFDG